MSMLSKLFAGTLQFRLMTASCYEFGHTWNPSCCGAIYDALWDAFFFCFKTYGTLYLVNSVVRANANLKQVKFRRLIYDTLRSTIFLTTNLAGHLFFICKFRQILGFAVWPTVSFLSGFLSSFIAIFIEAKKRRLMLALYLLNLASETVFRQLMFRRFIYPLPKAETILFCIGLFVIFFYSVDGYDKLSDNKTKYDLQKNNNNPMQNNIINSIKRLIALTHRDINISDDLKKKNVINLLTKVSKCLPDVVWQLCGLNHILFDLQNNVDRTGFICALSSIKQCLRNFCCILLLNTSLLLYQNIHKSNAIFALMHKKENFLRMPTFFAMMPLIYQVSEYLLLQKFKSLHNNFCYALCGGLSGLAMLIWPSINISMFVLWKAIEVFYDKCLKKLKFVPSFKNADILLYTLASGYVVGIAVLEPHALRKNYYKFLCNLTGNRLQLFNRKLLDEYFGFDSSRLYKNFFPQLLTKHLTINSMIAYSHLNLL